LVAFDERSEDVAEDLLDARLWYGVSISIEMFVIGELYAYQLLGYQSLIEKQKRHEANNAARHVHGRVEAGRPNGAEFQVVHVTDQRLRLKTTVEANRNENGPE
jgi:hypothetical protein